MLDIEDVVEETVHAAVDLHKRTGPGLLESVYETVLAYQLERRGLHVKRQKSVEFELYGHRFRQGLKVDLLVNDLVIVELKSVDELAPVHYKQLLTYLRLLDLKLGLLLNFGAPTMKQGIRRVANGYTPLASSRLRVNHVRTPAAEA